MPYLKEKWEALSPKTQKILQVVVGLIIAAGCAYCLSIPRKPDAGFFDIPTLIAIALVLVLPRLLEVQTGGAQLKLMRKVMLISLLVFILSFIGYGLITGTFAGPLVNSPGVTASPAASPVASPAATPAS